MQGETSEARCHYTSCVDSRYTYLKNVLKTDGKKTVKSTFRPQENLVRQETTEQRVHTRSVVVSGWHETCTDKRTTHSCQWLAVPTNNNNKPLKRELIAGHSSSEPQTCCHSSWTKTDHRSQMWTVADHSKI